MENLYKNAFYVLLSVFDWFDMVMVGGSAYKLLFFGSARAHRRFVLRCGCRRRHSPQTYVNTKVVESTGLAICLLRLSIDARKHSK